MKFAFRADGGYMLWSYEFCFHGKNPDDIAFFELNENAKVFKPALQRQTIGKLILKSGEEIRLVKNNTVISKVCHTILENMKDALGENKDLFHWTFFNRRTDLLTDDKIEKVVLVDGIETK